MVNLEMRQHSRGIDHPVLADDLRPLADTIAVCDRLCLLTAPTVVKCAVSLPDPTANRKGAPRPLSPSDTQLRTPKCFVPKITRDLRQLPSTENEGKGGGPNNTVGHTSAPDQHPTTSAQCIAALQALLPNIRRFRLGAHESKGVAFYPIERRALEVFEPGKQHQKIRETIVDGLYALVGEPAALDSTEQSLESITASATGQQETGFTGSRSAPIGTAPPSLTSSTFKKLHPFTCAQVLRAIAPSLGVYKEIWWQSLFIVLWFLHRRVGSLSGYPNAQSTDAPGTAFLTNRCIDALETVFKVFERRRDRFKKLTELMRRLKDAQERQSQISSTDPNSHLLSNIMFVSGYEHESKVLVQEIRSLIEEIGLDTSIPDLYRDWRQNAWGNAAVDPSLEQIAQGFVAAVEKVSSQVESISTLLIRLPLDIRERVAAIDDRITNRRGEAQLDRELLPDWICSAVYWGYTGKALSDRPGETPNGVDEEFEIEVLARHWRRHRTACERATRTIQAFWEYVNQILATFVGLPEEFRGGVDGQNVAGFIEKLSHTTDRLSSLRQRLANDMEIGVRWADTLMNRQIAYAVSGAFGYFDPNELAHAAQVVCRSGRIVNLDVILKALDIVCGAQRPDGAWNFQQAFHWGGTGSSSSPLSVETARAVVSTVTMLLRNPERFGASVEEISQRLHGVYEALDRFFRWISGNMQSFPPAGNEDTPLYGWCSDRVYEPGRIDSWVTANVVEYLVEFRHLAQERINARLRSEFLSHAPTELIPLTNVDPTDLDRPERERVISQLLEESRHHRSLELIEGPWLAIPPPLDPPISFWSGIFYGPPGTSKTLLAKGIAAHLGWPIISLSPADFLARGDQHVESRAQEIFMSLGYGSRLVYFFDEIDELIRDRRQINEKGERSVFSFLTPSFLTKLQDFRDTAKRKEFVFILATNYLDNIDAAAKRTGRIDRQLSIVYPDLKSRAHLIFKFISGKQEQFADLCRSLTRVKELEKERLICPSSTESFLGRCAEFTGFLSYSTIKELSDNLIKRVLAEANQNDPSKLEKVFNELIEEMCDIHLGISTRFKPEIKLKDYARRFEAGLEIKVVANVLPEGRFPWKDGRGMPSPTQARLERTEQLLELYKEIRTNEEIAASSFQTQLKTDFPNVKFDDQYTLP